MLRLIEIFLNCPFHFEDASDFVALVGDDYNFLEGIIRSSDGDTIQEADYRKHLEHRVIPYSQASGYTFEDQTYMVGALPRINLSEDLLHPKTSSKHCTIIPARISFLSDGGYYG